MSPQIILSPWPPVDSTTTIPTRLKVRVPVDLLHRLDPKLAVHLLPDPENLRDGRILSMDYAWPVLVEFAQTMDVILFGGSIEPKEDRAVSLGFIREENEDGAVVQRPSTGFTLHRNVTKAGLEPQLFTLTLTAEEPGDDGKNKLVFTTIKLADGEERDLINWVADTSKFGEPHANL